MIKINDFFSFSNAVSGISEEEYQKVNLFIDTLEAVSRITNNSFYIIDYFKKNFLYVSDNPLFLCGHTAEEVKSLGYMFYLNHVSEEEQVMLIEINRAGFEFFNKIPVEDRLQYTISYNFHLKNKNKKQTLINHKLTPIRITVDGRIWLAVCIVSLSSRDTVGRIEMRKKGEFLHWEYSKTKRCWKEEKGISINDKEKEILSLSIQGYTISEIADKVCLSLDSIKFYRRKLFEKINVRNITEAIAFASIHKLI